MKGKEFKGNINSGSPGSVQGLKAVFLKGRIDQADRIPEAGNPGNGACKGIKKRYGEYFCHGRH
jgi:hypothetical protein